VAMAALRTWVPTAGWGSYLLGRWLLVLLPEGR